MVRGSNPGGGEIFRTRPDWPWGPPSFLYNGYRVFSGGKAPGAWRWPSTPSSVEFKERVELYFYSHYGLSWPVLWWSVPLPLPTINMPPNSLRWLATLTTFDRGYKSWSFSIYPFPCHSLPLWSKSGIFLGAISLCHSLITRDQEPHP